MTVQNMWQHWSHGLFLTSLAVIVVKLPTTTSSDLLPSSSNVRLSPNDFIIAQSKGRLADNTGRHRRSDTGVIDSRHLPRLPLNSTVCQLRGLCGERDKMSQVEFVRNCFCDELCSVYDDCCRDYVPLKDIASSVTAPNVRLSPSVATCHLMPNITTGTSSEVWVVGRCPHDYVDLYVRTRCERRVKAGEPGKPGGWLSTTSDAFYRLPVNGVRSRILYANVYCALCSGETELPIFWQAIQRCSEIPKEIRTDAFPSSEPSLQPVSPESLKSSQESLSPSLPSQLSPSNSSSAIAFDIRHFVRAGCPIAFAPTSDADWPMRRCVSHIRKCDHRWKDTDGTARRCRQQTDYVYGGQRVFRNRYCAKCNYVNETYLQCEDTRHSESTDDETFVASAPIVVRLDFNRRQAVVAERRDSVKETILPFKSCDGNTGTNEANSDQGNGRISLYDPFSDQCHLLYCDRKTGEIFRDGACVRMPRVADSSVGIRSGNDDGTYRLQDNDDDISHGNELRKIAKTTTTKKSLLDDDDDDEEDDDENAEEDSRFTAPGINSSDAHDSTADCNDYELVNQDDYRSVGGDKIFVVSRNLEFEEGAYFYATNGSLFICTDWTLDPSYRSRATVTPPRHGGRRLSRSNFTILRYETAPQRLASFSGIVLAILCTAGPLTVYLLYASLRQDTYGKSFLCLIFSLLLAHILYLVIQLVERFAPGPLTCFCLSAAAQFASLAVVFWLNVMSIIVFNAMLRAHALATSSCASTSGSHQRHHSPVPSASSSSDSVIADVARAAKAADGEYCASFLLFSLYAWVVPLGIVAASIAIAAFKIDGWYEADEQVVTSCWALGLSQLLLMLVPVGLIVVGNYAMFGVVFGRLCVRPIRRFNASSNRDLKRSAKSSSGATVTTAQFEQQVKRRKREVAEKLVKKHEKRYAACFQLTLITTLMWTIGALAIFTRWSQLWYLFIGFDALLSVAVTMVALCNARAWRLMGQRRNGGHQLAREGGGDGTGSGECAGPGSHSETAGTFCTLEADGTTVYLKDLRNKVILRETSI